MAMELLQTPPVKTAQIINEIMRCMENTRKNLRKSFTGHM